MRKIYLLALFLFAATTAFCQNPLLLKDVYPGAIGSGIQQIVKTSNYTFFNADDDDADADRGLYRTDGTPGGTIKLNLTYLPDPPPSPNNYNSTKADELTALGDKIIFAGDNFANYGEIWASDGTQAGTVAIERFQPTIPNKVPVVEIAAMGSNAYYSVVDGSNHALLKKTDGTAGGTALVFDFNTVFASAPQVVLFKELNNVLYFIVYDAGGTGYDHLWRTDGTTAGTYELINFGSTQYVASNLMVAGNNLYVMIVTPGTGNVLWKTDGTVAGTVAVKTIGTTGNNNYPQNAAIGSTLYFSGLDANGMELWKTDGTSVGTIMVADLNTGSANSSPNNFTILNNNLYFNATTAATGGELWKFDGITTSLVKDIYPGINGSNPSSLATSNGTILFRASNDGPGSGSELWITDGTAANTKLVADINLLGGSGPSLLTSGNPVYFTANNGINGVELFKYDNSSNINDIHSKIYVNDNITLGDVFTTAVGSNSNAGTKAAPVATIDYAYSLAQIGDTIFVDAGSFVTPNLTIAKGITIFGANYLISPIDAVNKSLVNSSRQAESIISGTTITLAASDINIEGCTLDPGNKQAFLLSPGSLPGDLLKFKLAKNIVRINHTSTNLNSFGINGKVVTSPSLPLTSDFMVIDNRFEKSGSVIATSLFLNYIKNVTFTGNSFVVTGSTFKTQTAVNLGTNGIVDGATFSNNFIEGYSIFVNTNRVSSAILTSNKIVNTDRALNVSSIMPESSSLEFSNNIMETTSGGGGFIGYNRSGTSLAGTSNLLKIENNMITGVAVGGLAGQLFGAMNFAANNTVLNPSFIIRGNKINYSGDFSAITSEFVRPITIRGNIGSVTIEKNEIVITNGITMLPRSTSTMPSNPGITINTDFGSGSYMTAGSVVNILNNTVQGFKQSLVFYDAFNGINPYIGYGNIPPGATVNVSNNSFTGDSISINNGAVGAMINANCNWYGVTSALNMSVKVTEATVNDAPWLTDGTDADPATGFQPLADVCNGTPVDADIVQTKNVTCNGAANGSINVLVEEGHAPFTYAWSKDDVPDFSTAQDLTDLAPGFYKLIVTDAGGSVDTVFTTITEPAVLSATSVGNNNRCFGESLGSAEVTATGGVLPYTYLWSNGATTASIANLVAGTYYVTVTDANGCTTTANYNVTQPDILTVNASGTNVFCFGGNNGTVNVSVSGGTTSYSFLWSNGATTQSINNLTEGIYSVTVTDANGCTATSNYNVTQPTLLTAIERGTDVACYGGNNGTASVLVNGGTTQYFFLWSNGATTQSLNNLIAGTYSVTVTDVKGCSASASYTVTQPPLLTVVLTGTKASCVGSVTATPSGGTTPYSYLWSNGGNTETLNGIPNGTYTVTVTDANNCITSGTYTVTGNSPINPTTSQINVSCFGASNGSITVTGAGGTPPHIYSVNGSPYQSNNVFTNLIAGTYLVGVKDATGCFDFVSRTITQPLALTVVLDSVRNACFATNNGRIYITANGGTGTKTYSWTGPNGFTSTVQDPNNLFGGTYNLTVTDTKGCTATLMVNVIERPLASISEVITNVGCKGDFTGAINATVTGGSGSGFTYKWTGPNGFLASTEDIAAIKAGSYTLVATDKENGCAVTKIIVVSQPAAVVSLTTAKTNATGCNTLGTITGTGAGGTAPYQYSLDGTNYQSSNLFTGLYAGTDTIWVKDANGCTTFKVVAITDNGSDQYEANNAQNKAAVIAINATNVFARIAPLATDVDWFKFTTGNVSTSHTVTLTHPSVNYTFALYNSTGTLITPTDTGAITKTYASLAVNTVYSIKVSGALSYQCYNISVSNTSVSARSIAPPVSSEINGSEFKNAKPSAIIAEALIANAYPNPHHGIFNLQINSPENGLAIIDLFNANGQKVITKNVLVKTGTNTVTFNNIKESLLLYKITIGKNSVSGKVIGPK